MYELIEDGVKVQFEDIGEGMAGDYEPDDPYDVPLLRFYISKLEDGEWVDVTDGSYCTLIDVATPAEKVQGYLGAIMREVGDDIRTLGEIRRSKVEALSWLGQGDPHYTQDGRVR